MDPFPCKWEWSESKRFALRRGGMSTLVGIFFKVRPLLCALLLSFHAPNWELSPRKFIAKSAAFADIGLRFR